MKMNLPNKLTMIRIFLVIPLIAVFIAFMYYTKFTFAVDTKTPAQYFLYAAGTIFIFAMITDAVDGHLARKNNQITTFGKLFDPLADKIITTTTFIFLAVFNYTYVWAVVIFIIRDLIVDGSRNVIAANNLDVAASIWGKLKTVFQSICIPVLLFFIPLINLEVWWHILLINIPTLIALIASIISGFIYFKQVLPIINKSK